MCVCRKKEENKHTDETFKIVHVRTRHGEYGNVRFIITARAVVDYNRRGIDTEKQTKTSKSCKPHMRKAP